MSKKNFEKPPIGKVEMLILEYLTDHRSTLIQRIEKGIGKTYKVVFEAVKRLLNRGLIQTGKEVEGKSYTSYELSKRGLAFLWAYSRSENAIKASLRNYEDLTLAQGNQNFLTLEKNIPTGLMLKVIKLTGLSILNYGEKAIDIHNQFANIIINSVSRPSVSFTPSEARRLKRLGLLVPETKSHVLKVVDELKDWANSSPEDYKDE
jgi:DNA-binding MarR family transcriptional regulator